MTTLVALSFGLVVWIVLWSIGVSAFDSFLVTLAIVVPAAAWQIFSPGIKKMLGQTPPPSSAP
jgi:hypothetical protein